MNMDRININRCIWMTESWGAINARRRANYARHNKESLMKASTGEIDVGCKFGV